MTGVGPQELLLAGLLFLVVFGLGKAASIARGTGRFVGRAQNTVQDFKSEPLDSDEVKVTRRSVEELKDEVNSSSTGEERDSYRPSEDETHQLTEGGKPPPGAKVPPAAPTRAQVEKEQPTGSFDGFGFGGLADTRKGDEKPTKSRRPWGIL